jgi:hypothetical protein
MKEKTYRKVQPYGYIMFAGMEHHYPLLSPHPMVKDSWQLNEQERWAVAIPDYAHSIRVCEPDGHETYHAHHTPANMIAANAIIILHPYMPEIYVWDGEYVDVEAEKSPHESSYPDLEGDYEEIADQREDYLS